MQTLLPFLSCRLFLFFSSARVLVQNVSHENDLIFMRMNAQVIYIFIPIVLHKDAFYHRGKSKLGIEVFIHELLREPLIVWAVIASRRTLTRKHRFHCNPTKNPTDNDNLIVCTLYHVYQCTNLHLESRNASQCFSLLLLPFLLQFFLFSSSVLQFFFFFFFFVLMVDHYFLLLAVTKQTLLFGTELKSIERK